MLMKLAAYLHSAADLPKKTLKSKNTPYSQSLGAHENNFSQRFRNILIILVPSTFSISFHPHA